MVRWIWSRPDHLNQILLMQTCNTLEWLLQPIASENPYSLTKELFFRGYSSVQLQRIHSSISVYFDTEI
ncbi:unnamed protein product [Allacma fusca]|uniref:Uncharacterized protein n=1 Tax=Allacma fusca TaxID=39272 RepID=A0A8J2JG60_9HEXA|nr:unnamed protein product [Allacma fusca]